MALTGNFSGLAKLATTLETLGNKALPAMALKGAVVLNGIVEEQFAQGVDPYGRSWAPLKPATVATGRTPPPLTDTGKMRRKAKAIPGVRKITEKIPFPAPIHQSGSKDMASRMLVPHGVLPPKWSNALQAAGVEVISSELLKK